MLGGLPEETLGYDEFNITTGNQDLLKAIFDAANAVGHKGKAWAVEDRFLDAGHKAKAQIFTDFAHFAQEVEIENQFLIFAALEIV